MSSPRRAEQALAAKIEAAVRTTGGYLAVLSEGTDNATLATFHGGHGAAVAILKAGGLPVTLRTLMTGDPAMPPGARLVVIVEALDDVDVIGDDGALNDASDADLIVDLIARLTQQLREDGHVVLPLPRAGADGAPAGPRHLGRRVAWLALADRVIAGLQAEFGHQLAVAHRTGAEMGLADAERVIVVALPDPQAGEADDAA